jgi:hypothetical protein
LPPAKEVTRGSVMGKTFVRFLGYGLVGFFVATIVYTFAVFAVQGDSYDPTALFQGAEEVGLSFGVLAGTYAAGRFYNRFANSTRCPHCARTFAFGLQGQRELLDSWQSQKEEPDLEIGQTNYDIHDTIGRKVGSSSGTTTRLVSRTVTVTHQSFLESLTCRFCGFAWKRTAIYRVVG